MLLSELRKAFESIPECAGSRLISEDKLGWTWLVLGWEKGIWGQFSATKELRKTTEDLLKINILKQGQQTFSIKNQKGNILGFVSCMVLITSI